VCAAIGCAQMEDVQSRIDRRRAIHDLYVELFRDCDGIEVHCNPNGKFESNYWLTTIQLSNKTVITPDELRQRLLDRHIETRLMWYPMHLQPVFKGMPFYGNGVSGRLFERGLCLPSSSCLSDSDVKKVADAIKLIIKE
ncbi:MAG: DegT/DnrJ/EryC1/StrS family aminotransferase, partial [Muribaculaceae bacterium]|nr:DegT/DnrJ/EryC1/StrS family aminotransferase [Muribaculaceae bacterium]